MLVLHLSFHDAEWFIWGETRSHEEAPPRRGTGTSPSPFAASAEQLEKALPLYMPSAKRVRANAWLPTYRGLPVVSSPIITPQAAKNIDPSLQLWEVEALVISSLDAAQFLGHCRGRDLLGVGVVIGKDICSWSRVLEFAASLVSRELYLPNLVQRQSTFIAQWEPLISGDDSSYQHALRQQMPGSCFALTTTAAKEPPLANLQAATYSLVDALVRGSAKVSAHRAESVHAAWLNALRSPSAVVTGDSLDLAQMVRHVADWRRRLSALTTSTHRLGFRVVEAGNLDKPWRLEFLLRDTQGTASIPVIDIWPTAHSEMHQFILMAIGQASAICPMLEDAARASAPSGVELTGSEILTFLSEYSSTLRLVGFFVEVPSWWAGRSTKVRLALRAKVDSPSTPSVKRITLNSLLSVSWEIALGDGTVTIEELEQLAKFSSPLVKLRGQWVQLEEGQLARTIKAVRAGNPSLSLARLLRATTGADEVDAALPVEHVRASGWVGEFLAEFTGTKQHKAVPLPAGFAGSLRSYQEQGYSWLEFLARFGLGACLADDMGLGKTIQTLALLQHRVEAGHKGPYLLICPTSIIFNWEKEAARFTTGLKVLAHHGPDRSRETADLVAGLRERNLVITSYTLAMRDHVLLQSLEWEGVILDEAQNIKNPDAKQSKVIRALPSGFRLALTGTPVENSVSDLWSLMEFLNSGLLGSQAEFRRNFLLPIHLYRDKSAVERLKKITQPFILRRLKTDQSVINDLPPKVESKVYCTLTHEQAGLYAAVIKNSEAELRDARGMGRRGLILATISKLKQICNDPSAFLGDGVVRPERSGKLTRLLELASDITGSGEKALIFTQYVEMGRVLTHALTESLGKQALFLHGGVGKKVRESMIESYQDPEGPPFFVLSLKAGGTGLNLTQASHVIHYDRWWNPAVEDQATDRAHRIGQLKSVQVHKFICAGTLEERIDEMISGKTTLAKQVVSTSEAWLTELSSAELKELWKLSGQVWRDSLAKA